ncbi:hypothetical protein Egran_02312 [Elaphomyces granulatus]|uniref:Uncharacterized protein n=1 Tax=Elaphomyces granulatus TaxID=519963 RepID=A0A232M0I8_9EURO|nr:hypothetical protein Egran_02312 [Elaphomyces granulatus]
MRSFTVDIEMDISPAHRSREENQERAFVAASRRKDRSLDARLESAYRASILHKQRTGKALNITKEIVEDEAMYEEVDERLPERRILMLQNQNEQVEERFQRQLIAIFGSPNGIPRSRTAMDATYQMRSDIPSSDPLSQTRMVNCTIPAPISTYSSPATTTTSTVASSLSRPPARVNTTRSSYMPPPENWSSAVMSTASSSIWPIPPPYISAASSAPSPWLTSQSIAPLQQPTLEPLLAPSLSQSTRESDSSALEASQHQVRQQPSTAPGPESPNQPQVTSAPESSEPAPFTQDGTVQSNDATITHGGRAQSEPSYVEYLEEIDRPSVDLGLQMSILEELETQLPETTIGPETCTTPELDMSPSPTTPKLSPCLPLTSGGLNDQSTVMIWTEDRDPEFDLFSQLAADLENDSELTSLDNFLLDDYAMFDGDLGLVV